MPTELLATGATVGSASDDQTLAAGDSMTVCLKGADYLAEVAISLKDDGDAYNEIGKLTAADSAKLLEAPGTYQFKRVNGTCGVFSA